MLVQRTAPNIASTSDIGTGMTSNPSIFEKAILQSDDYEQELSDSVGEPISAQQVYERIAIKATGRRSAPDPGTAHSGVDWLRSARGRPLRPLERLGHLYGLGDHVGRKRGQLQRKVPHRPDRSLRVLHPDPQNAVHTPAPPLSGTTQSPSHWSPLPVHSPPMGSRGVQAPSVPPSAGAQ